VICHLGNGCSASAIRDGTPLTNTMGFTPLDGLMMGSRPGSLDPGVLPFLKRNSDLSDELECLGLRLDPTGNDEVIPDAEIQSPDSKCRVLVIHTREDLVMLREMRSELESG